MQVTQTDKKVYNSSKAICCTASAENLLKNISYYLVLTWKKDRKAFPFSTMLFQTFLPDLRTELYKLPFVSFLNLSKHAFCSVKELHNRNGVFKIFFLNNQYCQFQAHNNLSQMTLYHISGLKFISIMKIHVAFLSFKFAFPLEHCFR